MVSEWRKGDFTRRMIVGARNWQLDRVFYKPEIPGIFTRTTLDLTQNGARNKQH